jgi:D-glutamate N-acetyltransferase
MLGAPRRLAILAEGQFSRLDAKTAVGVLRYRPNEVAAILDSTRAGHTAASCVGVGGECPVVADVSAAAALGADSLMIGIAPRGGALPEAWRGVVRDALVRGWDVLSGLHVFLADDPEFEALAARHGGRLLDVRRPDVPRVVASGRAARVDAFVVLTVGTDCNVGKMTASLELARALRSRGRSCAFVATGQTGIFIADHGVAIDAVPADFAAGAIETLVIEAAREADVVLVEGQGALHHPGFSGVTLSLLHGACPAAMVLCHEAARSSIRRSELADDASRIPPLADVLAAYENAAAWFKPAPVVGIALNTSELGEAAAREACARASAETGRPATDPVRFDAAPLADALLHARAEWERRRTERATTRAAGRSRATPA